MYSRHSCVQFAIGYPNKRAKYKNYIIILVQCIAQKPNTFTNAWMGVVWSVWVRGEGGGRLIFVFTYTHTLFHGFYCSQNRKKTTKVYVMMLKLKTHARWRPAKNGKLLQRKDIKLKSPNVTIDVFD